MDFIRSCEGRWQRNEAPGSKDSRAGFDTKTHRRVDRCKGNGKTERKWGKSFVANTARRRRRRRSSSLTCKCETVLISPTARHLSRPWMHIAPSSETFARSIVRWRQKWENGNRDVESFFDPYDAGALTGGICCPGEIRYESNQPIRNEAYPVAY